ncbi:Protein SAAL1 [Microtus ochrogaster]|uniref:Protein SAAL1 n=1 Tax=Microtus ochrogaster TaxID=79684 RepID=A0A8J6KUT5_MICOH|nr:Protein SAAL1 [Microtus ochrogaster]
MHILQLLTTVDDGIQAIVQCPDTAKDTWNLLFDLVCHEFCQVGDPPIILQEQKTVLASVFSVMSAISASWAAQEHPKREEGKFSSLPPLKLAPTARKCQACVCSSLGFFFNFSPFKKKIPLFP